MVCGGGERHEVIDYALLASDWHQLGAALARIQGQKQQRPAWLTSRRVTKQPVGDATGDVFEEAVHRNISAQDQYLIAVKFSVDEMLAMSHLVRCWLRLLWGQHDCDRRREGTVILTPCQYIGVREIFVQQRIGMFGSSREILCFKHLHINSWRSRRMLAY